MQQLLEMSEAGLYCPQGGFHIDPWGPVARAVITHAHSDHLRAGSGDYLTSSEGVELVKSRVDQQSSVRGLDWGDQIDVNGVRLSLWPAGHVLGSAQVRIERNGQRWVFSGDYKLRPDPTCRPFEPVPCDVFISEATFGLPIYRWPAERQVIAEIESWWRANQRDARTSVLYAYTLGKSQRLLAELNSSIGPIYVHGALLKFIEIYRAAGVKLPEVKHGMADEVRAKNGMALVIAPLGMTGETYLRKLGDISQAQASGWMRVRGRRRWRSLDRGFVLSDHADWEGLQQAIRMTGSRRVGITHGYTAPMARYLSEQGYETFTIETRYTGESETEISGNQDAEIR